MKNQKDNNVLGKGLAALLSNNSTLLKIETGNNTAIKISVDSIVPNPFQPRTEFEEVELNELRQSIMQYGVIQPILVRKHNDKYQLVAGERRWQASKLAGLKEIPAIIKDIDDKNLFEIAVIENIQRENLTALEEAIAYEKFIKEYNYSQESLAIRIGKSRSHISNTLRLLLLPTEIQSLLNKKIISAGHARAILNSENQDEIVNRIIDENLSVRATEKLVREASTAGQLIQQKPGKNMGKIEKFKDEELLQIEAMLSASLGMKVSINNGHNGGQVSIKFDSLAHLDHLIQLLNGDKLSF